ncbi:MAG: hypothetical protein R6U39_06925 [Candidatus Aegiribacteria sp.]
MSDISILVRLKAPDPEAMTALATLRRVSPDICPVGLERYDHWRFTGPGVTRKVVEEIVSHYPDIVNPNKQSWSFTGDGLHSRGHEEELRWTGVLVTDRVDSVSENWSRIISGKGFPVVSVRYSVLWRLGFRPQLPEDEAGRRAKDLAVATHRERGLLANPVSQEIEISGPGTA